MMLAAVVAGPMTMVWNAWAMALLADQPVLESAVDFRESIEELMMAGAALEDADGGGTDAAVGLDTPRTMAEEEEDEAADDRDDDHHAANAVADDTLAAREVVVVVADEDDRGIDHIAAADGSMDSTRPDKSFYCYQVLDQLPAAAEAFLLLQLASPFPS